MGSMKPRLLFSVLLVCQLLSLQPGWSKFRTSAVKAPQQYLQVCICLLWIHLSLSFVVGLTGTFLFATTTARSSNALLGWNCGYAFCSNVTYTLLFLFFQLIAPKDNVWRSLCYLSRNISCKRQRHGERFSRCCISNFWTHGELTFGLHSLSLMCTAVRLPSLRYMPT